LNIIFIGHVDAGKSTLGGQILYISGQVDERTIERYQKEAKEKNRESWFLAYILDLGEEEREKGKTTDVSRAGFETKKKRYTILDAPGHRNYVPNMIGGASQADVAVLVVSARKGEFESGFEKDGQTREHATLAKTLGVKRLVVAINKMDDPTVEWGKDRYDQIVTEITKFLKGVGYDPKKTVTFLPLSGQTGLNVFEKLKEGIFPSYTGGSLVDVLDDLDLKNPNSDKSLRIPIIDRYKDRGNIVILGKIESGTVRRGDKIVIMPTKVTAEIGRIKLHHMEVDVARAGENVQITMKGLENLKDGEAGVGCVVCDNNDPLYPIDEFLGQFLVLEHKPIFAAGYKANLHVHTSTVPCTITSLVAKLDKKGEKEPKPPKYAQSGCYYIAKMKTDVPICVEKYDTLQQLGRFTLREGKTVAIGRINAIKPLQQNVVVKK
jgi:peptide chain release factor subunit 3